MTHEPKEAVEKLRKWKAMNEPQYNPESKQELEKVGFELAGLLFNYIQTYYPNNQDLIRFMNQDKKEFFMSMIQGLDKKHGELLDHVALMLLEAVRKEREYEIPEEFKFKQKSKEEI